MEIRNELLDQQIKRFREAEEENKRLKSLSEAYKKIIEARKYGEKIVIISPKRFYDEQYVIDALRDDGYEIGYESFYGYMVIDWTFEE